MFEIRIITTRVHLELKKVLIFMDKETKMFKINFDEKKFL